MLLCLSKINNTAGGPGRSRVNCAMLTAMRRASSLVTARFPKMVEAIASLPVRSCVIDGEAIVVDERGLSVFDARYRLRDHAAVLCAFDLIELDGEDLRWARLEDRKHALADLLRGTDDGIAEVRPTSCPTISCSIAAGHDLLVWTKHALTGRSTSSEIGLSRTAC